MPDAVKRELPVNGMSAELQVYAEQVMQGPRRETVSEDTDRFNVERADIERFPELESGNAVYRTQEGASVTYALESIEEANDVYWRDPARPDRQTHKERKRSVDGIDNGETVYVSINQGGTLEADFFYPIADSAIPPPKIVIGLTHVRAASDLTITFDFERNGYVITALPDRAKDDPAPVEVAFVPADPIPNNEVLRGK